MNHHSTGGLKRSLSLLTSVLLALIMVLCLFFLNASQQKQASAADGVIVSGNFAIDHMAPSAGPAAGGNTVNFTGSNMPWNSTDAYTRDADGDGKDDLILLCDGINNTGNGDLNHNSSTTIWKDLSGHGNNIILGGGAHFTDDSASITATSGQYAAVCDNSGKIKNVDLSGYSHITIEIRFIQTNNSTEGIFMEQANDSNLVPGAFYLITNYSGIGNSVLMQNSNANTNAGPWTAFTAVPGGAFLTYTMTFSSVPDPSGRLVYLDGQKADQRYALSSGSSPYDGSVSGNINKFADLPIYFFQRGANVLNPSGGNSWPVNGELQTVRIYGSKIGASELAQNQDVDAHRFVSPPTVTFGDKTATNVAVQSTTRMTCQVPAGTAGQTVDVKVSYNGSTPVSVGSYTYTAGADPSVGIAVNGAANPTVSGWPKGASVDTNSNLLTLSTGSYTLATDDAWSEDSTLFSDHALSIAPGAAVSISIVPSASGRALLLEPISAIINAITIGQGATLTLTSTSGGRSPTYLYCRGNPATNLSGVTGNGTFVVSGLSRLYACGSGSSPAIAAATTRILSGSVWTQSAAGATPSVSPAPTGSVSGKTLRPVYFSTSQYGSLGDATIPVSGAGGNLSSDYRLPLSDMQSVGGTALAGISGVAWLPS